MAGGQWDRAWRSSPSLPVPVINCRRGALLAAVGGGSVAEPYRGRVRHVLLITVRSLPGLVAVRAKLQTVRWGRQPLVYLGVGRHRARAHQTSPTSRSDKARASSASGDS